MAAWALLACWATVANAEPVVSLVGESTPRTIPLDVTSTPTAGSLHGTVLLALRNSSSTPQRVVVLLASDSLPKLITLQHTLLPAGALEQIPVPVQLPSGTEPEALNGTLIVEASQSARSRPTEQFALPVSGTLRPLGDVRFAPGTAIVQVTRWCLFFPCNTTGGGEIKLYGTGVGQLIKQLAGARTKGVSTVLHAGSKKVAVELSGLHPDPEHPDSATAHLTLLSKPSAGNYTGSLALEPLLTESPSLPIEVHSRYMVAWPVLIIVFGIASAGILYQQLGLWRRKRLLRGLLEEAVDREYCPRHSENQVVEAPEGRLIRPLKIACPLREDSDWNYDTELDSSRSIYTAIRWARNDADLDEAQTAAVTLVRGIKRWLLLLTEVQALWMLSNEPRERQGEWDQTRTASDSRLVLLKARHAQLDSGNEATKLLISVPQQDAWHRAVAEAWDLRERLISTGGATQPDAEAVVLTPVANPPTSIVTRSEEEQENLELTLEGLYGQLLKLRETSNTDAATDEVHLATIADAENELQAESLRNDLSSLESGALLAPARLAASRALLTPSDTPADDIEPAVDIAPAAAVADVVAPAAVAGPAAPAHAPVAPRASTRSRSKQLLLWFKLLDLMASGVILLIVSLIYTSTVYGENWGSITDWATAFGAGFGGQVTGKWALLPIYRSLRLRTSSTTEAESVGG